MLFFVIVKSEGEKNLCTRLWNNLIKLCVGFDYCVILCYIGSYTDEWKVAQLVAYTCQLFKLY